MEKPMPISYSLVSIAKLFNGKYFTVEDVDIQAIGQELLDALKERLRQSSDDSRCYKIIVMHAQLCLSWHKLKVL